MDRPELGRRSVHVGGVVFPLAYLLDLHVLGGNLVTWPRLRMVYLVGCVIAIGLEFFRLAFGLEWWVYRQLTREYEQSNPAGYALYTVGAAISVLAFQPAVAIPALLALGFVDPISGMLTRRDHRRVKRWYVLLVTFCLSLGVGVPFVPVPAAILGAVAVTVADGVKPTVGGYVLDDNFTIPVSASVAIWIGLEYLPPVA